MPKHQGQLTSIRCAVKLANSFGVYKPRTFKPTLSHSKTFVNFAIHFVGLTILRRRFVKFLRALTSHLALIVLSLNIFICSIPRCNLVFMAIQESDTLQEEVAEASSHCHDEAGPDLQGLVKFSSPHLCQCQLLQFVSILPAEPVRSFAPTIQAPIHWEISFIVSDRWADFIPSIEPPYPKV